jgi:L-histidine N-alpha-methyltransferase
MKLLDMEPASADEAQEILKGFRLGRKHISPKYFYDEKGSRLFDQICKQPEYYPTRTELGIMHKHVKEMAALAGRRASLIEFGSGSSTKTRLLIEALDEPAAYVPVDISREHLLSAAKQLADAYPDIEVLPVCADFTQPFNLPEPRIMPEHNIIYFPGSTIGNFSYQQSIDLMRVMREEARDDGALLIGVDLIKDKEILEPAYNDAAGVTARFNLNLLRRLNREHDANFSLDSFEHLAVFDEEDSRIEMRLVSLEKQQVQLAGEAFELERDEYIITEHSHKYSLEKFAAMAKQAGFKVDTIWTDDDELFSVQYLVAA